MAVRHGSVAVCSVWWWELRMHTDSHILSLLLLFLSTFCLYASLPVSFPFNKNNQRASSQWRELLTTLPLFWLSIFHFPFFPSYSCLLLHAAWCCSNRDTNTKIIYGYGYAAVYSWFWLVNGQIISYTLYHYTALTLTRDHAIVLVLRVTYTDTLHHVCVVR